LSARLFYIFIDDEINYIRDGNVHAPVTGNMPIPELLFAYDLAIRSFTVNV
jgi:hypothetical protein